MRLAAIVALSGALPLVLLALIGLQIVGRNGEQASKEALQAIAEQAAARITTYISQQREMLRTVSMAVGTEPDAPRRLEDVKLDAPSLGRVRLINKQTPPSLHPIMLRAEQMERALQGSEVASETYIAELSPAMDVCTPAGKPGSIVCATLDLLELQRQVQHIRIGQSGYALAFDRTGRLLAAGAGTLRAAVLSGEAVAESTFAVQLANAGSAPQRLASSGGADVLAGWAHLPDLGWSIAVEQPLDEALRGARTALGLLGFGAVIALILSLVLGAAQARKMLGSLEREERWRTAGRLAAGVSHDLGHRLAILQQAAALAATNDAAFLPRIRESLESEVSTLRKFVADFADLTREPRRSDFLPLELNALIESVRGTVSPQAAAARISIETQPAGGEVWVRADRYLLDRAVLNLVYNAIEASQPGARVVLSVRQAKDRALLQVEDRGAGIAEDRLHSLFDSFVSTKRTGAHVGMGLPNVRRIALAHDGDISVISQPGKGSLFTLDLPAAHSSSFSSLTSP
jgi:signal transduction histidine kinase